jgi:hypothetical protein
MCAQDHTMEVKTSMEIIDSRPNWEGFPRGIIVSYIYIIPWNSPTPLDILFCFYFKSIRFTCRQMFAFYLLLRKLILPTNDDHGFDPYEDKKKSNA